MLEQVERKEFLIQQAEKRLKDYEHLLREISMYDDYIRIKLE